jgi:hypothetical protein
LDNIPTISINKYCRGLLCGLRELSDEINNQCDSSLKNIFDQSWVEQVGSEIIQFCKQNRNTKPTPPFHSESEIFLTFFRCKDHLLELDRIVHGVDEVTKKKKVFRNKLKQLSNNNPSVVMGALLEFYSCGRFVTDEKLEDIDVKVSPESGSDSNVDAIIKIDNRKILVEVTLISKSFLEVEPEMIRTLDPAKIMKQIENKILEKTESGKQLAIATGPTILIIGLPSDYNDIYTSMIEELFDTREIKKISAIIINPGFFFDKGCVFYNPNANYPILRSEQNYLNQKFDYRII